MASASAGATEMTCSLALAAVTTSSSGSAGPPAAGTSSLLPGTVPAGSVPTDTVLAGTGTVLVQTISSTSGRALIRSRAPSQNSPCVQATGTDRAPRSDSTDTSSMIVVPRAISSSRTITSRPATSPMMELMVTWESLCRTLAPAATGRSSIRASAAACLALPRSGETTTVLLRSRPLKWGGSSRRARRGAEGVGQPAQRVQVVDGHREEAVHLRRVQGHGQDPADARGHQQVRDQAAADGHPRHVLLVGPGVGVVRDDRGHPGGRGAAGRVQHEQQLDEILLDRRPERLDQEDVPLPAVLLELDLQAVV